MINRKTKNLIVSVCFLAVVFLSVSCLGETQKAYAVENGELLRQNAEIAQYYSDFKENPTIKDIDTNDFFGSFYADYQATNDVNYFYKMQEIVSVAESLNSLAVDFVKEDYDAEDWPIIAKIIESTYNGIEVTSYFNKDALISKINNAVSTIVTGFLTKQEKFERLKALSVEKLENCINELSKVNVNTLDGKPETTLGFYDESATKAVDKIYEDTLNAINAQNFDKTKSEQISTFLSDTTENAIKRMKCEPKNQIERAYSLINDSIASAEGITSELTEEGTRLLATNACLLAISEFIPSLSSELKTHYAKEISLINAFSRSEFIDSSPTILSSEISSDNGVFTVYAFKRFDKTESLYKVFPQDVKISVLPLQDKTAFSAEIAKLNSKLSAGYAFNIELSSEKEKFEPTLNMEDGSRLIFKVAVDVEKYYQNYVLTKNALLNELFFDAPKFKEKFIDDISPKNVVTTNDYIRSLNKKDSKSSLIFSYNDAIATENKVETVNCELDTNGGIVMFETQKFGTFAVATNGGLNTTQLIILISAIALVVVVALVVVLFLVLRNSKYLFKFITNGGTPVAPIKARKDDCFAMPDAPTKEGYVFAGWFLNPELTVRFIDTKVSTRKGKKVYAKWVESTIPDNVVKYYEKLRNELVCYSKVGPIANMGLDEREIIAKLFADANGVNLMVDLSVNKLGKQGFNVEDAGEENAETPAKLYVNDKESCKEGIRLIRQLMLKKGLQNVGPAYAPQPMTLKEREEGFVYVIENDRVAVCLGDYYEFLRVYTKSFVVYNANSELENGELLTRMYLTDDCINLYLATSATGSLVDAKDKFEDTPSLFVVHDNAEDVKKACNLIDRVMEANGLERRNENANHMTLQKPKTGCGCGYVVTM